MLLATGCAGNAGSEKWSQRMVESHGINEFYRNRTLTTANWDYVNGLVANSVLKAWQQYPEKTEYYATVKAFADRNISADGKAIVRPDGSSALGESNIDDLAAGKIFFVLYEEELKKGNTADAERYKNAATLIRNTLKYNHSRIADSLPGAGGFFHKAIYPNQMWLDGLYMGPAVYAQWQSVFGAENPEENLESWSDIAHQFKTLHRYTYDAEKQLNYHAWSAQPADSNSFWVNKLSPMPGTSTEFWGRGMGWYFAALVVVLELMPADHPDRTALLENCNAVAAGLKRWQDPVPGAWFQLLQYDATMTADGIGDTVRGEVYNTGTKPNYLEASCSGMFTYAFLKGIRLGFLDKKTYKPVADKAFQGLLDTFITVNPETGVIDINQSCNSAGLGPYSNPSRTGTINYYLEGRDVGIVNNEGKAIGPFIMAALEKELAK
jgi:unsaturated rhamnogalacturonyl hydrolase